jgi:plasmid replication initiation protein
MYSIFSISTCFLKLPLSLRVSIKLFFKIAFTALSILLCLSPAFLKICELCYQYITTGSRKMEIQELKKFIGIGKNKTTSDLIRELKSSKKQINQKTNLEIEFITIKTSRKITHIKFNFCRTDQHPLDEINNKKNDIDTNSEPVNSLPFLSFKSPS